MSLSGTIGEVGLPDIVRLIAKSERSGLLRVTDGAVEGQIYLQEGAFSYATSRTQDSLLRDLVRLGLVQEEDRTNIERRKANIEDVLGADTDREKLREFLEEQVTEVLVRLLRMEKGSFEFQDGVTARYSTGLTFSVEAPLIEAEARLARWSEIEEVIPSPSHALRMSPELANGIEEVIIDSVSWTLLAALGGGSSVQEVTRALGMWEYPTAKNLARLVRQGLVVVAEAASGQVSRPAAEGHRVNETILHISSLEEQVSPGEHEERPSEPGPIAGADSMDELPQPDEERPEPASDLMRRWKQLRSRDRSAG
ncbi:MAG: DUF4388 domain-containing protein [Acidimicrobiia bacterium]